jgi:hypothetical protein
MRMRQCPTLAGDDRPLIAHSIEIALCTRRQREFYHKCHRCVFHGKAADYVVPGSEGAEGPSRNGSAESPAPLVIEVGSASGSSRS